MKTTISRLVPALSLLAVATIPVCGQTPLSRRIDAADGSAVQFNFSARSDVCGDGIRYMRIGTDSWVGSMNDATRMSACDTGPVRVVVIRSEREVIRMQSFVGPLHQDSSARDLGRVGNADAAAFLLALAREGDGRVSRDALRALSLADSVRIVPQLLEIARDKSKSRELRRAAFSYATQREATADALTATEIVRLSTEYAVDQSEHSSFRQSAVRTLTRMDRGEGIPTLIRFASDSDDQWLARTAIQALGSSGDPRGRRALRDMVTRDGFSGDQRIYAMRALADEYATDDDAKLLQRGYAQLTTERSRDVALEAIASIGTPGVRTWIAAIITDESELARNRRKAASVYDRAGATGRDMVRLYDNVGDDNVRNVLIDELARTGTKEAVTKLISIARDEGRPGTRKKAVSALGRFDDPEIRDALRGVVER
jgi:HEAT repeat protein